MASAHDLKQALKAGHTFPAALSRLALAGVLLLATAFLPAWLAACKKGTRPDEASSYVAADEDAGGSGGR